MYELRWNPLLETYTMVAANRQGRPNMPKDWCPFCPGSGKVPDGYEVHVYPNDFPALRQDPPAPTAPPSDLYQAAPSYGICEVILYSPDHYATLHSLSVAHITKLVSLWQERFFLHSQDEKVKYIFPFENRGPEVGVTMPHPHGQLYGYSFVPLKVDTELKACRKFYEENGTDLLGAMNADEKALGQRVIFENESFLCYLPYFTDYPYGVFVVAKDKVAHLGQFTEQHKEDLAWMLKHVVGTFDQLFDKLFPYMMVTHQAPINSPKYGPVEEYYRFHLEFYPPLRDAERIKFYASSEMGAWAAANVKAVEETAEELRQAHGRYLQAAQLA